MKLSTLLLLVITVFASVCCGLQTKDVAFYPSPLTVRPKGRFQINVNITADVDPNVVRLRKFNFVGNRHFWDNIDLVPCDSSPNRFVFGDRNIKAPAAPGKHFLNWTSVHQGNGVPEYVISTYVEVTCSDGNICNGMEQYVRGRCVHAPLSLCDDLQPCTIDTCSPQGICSHTRDPQYSISECPDCLLPECTPNCTDRNCGNDGCGGSCGTCTETQFCVAGTCGEVHIQGTCANPIDLTTQASSINWNGFIQLTGDNSEGVNILAPLCNSQSTATELVYMLHNTFASFVGIEARLMGIDGPDSMDTVLEIIEVKSDYIPSITQGCLDSNINAALVTACADDSSPPGGLASRITWVLKPGYYYFLVVDGYSLTQTGPFQLNITLTNTGCTLSCSGKYCGSANCQGLTCGNCDPGFACNNVTARCVPSPCFPDCTNKTCGDDGCGGSCGKCSGANACFIDSGQCLPVAQCDHMVPLCRVHPRAENFGCPDRHYCGTDCECHSIDDPMMDLFIDITAVQPVVVNNYLVESSSCAFAEGCLFGIGTRRIVKFSTNVGNQGTASFSPPNPPQDYPGLYEFASCHGHWHFSGFADFQLLNVTDGSVVVFGRKQSYCAEDSYRNQNGPSVNCFPTTTCDEQGLSVGWVDVYGPDLDCQFLDVTGVPSGNYIIRQCTNQFRTFQELTFENNCIEVPFFLPPVPN